MTGDCRKRLLAAVATGNVPGDEDLKCYGIYLRKCSLPSYVHAFVYLSSRCKCYIVVNKLLSTSARQKAYLHELNHVLVDMPKKSYIVGINDYHSEDELVADTFSNYFFKIANICN